jgi:hypothetical protein
MNQSNNQSEKPLETGDRVCLSYAEDVCGKIIQISAGSVYVEYPPSIGGRWEALEDLRRAE